MELINIKIGKGKKIHGKAFEPYWYPTLCGINGEIRKTEELITCKTCLKVINSRLNTADCPHDDDSREE